MNDLNLEQRIGLSKSLLATLEYCRHIPDFAIIEAKSAAEAYAGAFKYLGKGAKWLATPYARIVRDAVMLVPDGIRYIANGKNPEQKESQAKKVVSGSLALGELGAMTYGAHTVTSGVGNLATTLHLYLNEAVQAVVGSFIGSEVTTAAVLFAAYAGLTTLYKIKHAHSFNDLCIKSTLADSVKVMKKSIKEGILSFACADIPLSILCSLFMSPPLAATIGAAGGMLVYTHRTKTSLDSSVDKGDIGK